MARQENPFQVHALTVLQKAACEQKVSNNLRQQHLGYSWLFTPNTHNKVGKLWPTISHTHFCLFGWGNPKVWDFQHCMPWRLTTTLGEEPSDKLTVLDLPIAIGIRLNMKPLKHLIFNPSLATKMNSPFLGFGVGLRGFNRPHHPHIPKKGIWFLRVGTMFSSSCFPKSPPNIATSLTFVIHFATHPFTSTYVELFLQFFSIHIRR